MPAHDSAYSFAFTGTGTLKIIYGDASDSGNLPFQGSFKIKRGEAPTEEITNRGFPTDPPTLVEVGVAELEVELDVGLTGFLGSASIGSYEALSFTGLAASKTGTATGNRKVPNVELKLDHPDGSSETHTFSYAKIGDLDVDLPANGTAKLSTKFRCWARDHAIT